MLWLGSLVVSHKVPSIILAAVAVGSFVTALLSIRIQNIKKRINDKLNETIWGSRGESGSAMQPSCLQVA